MRQVGIATTWKTRTHKRLELEVEMKVIVDDHDYQGMH